MDWESDLIAFIGNLSFWVGIASSARPNAARTNLRCLARAWHSTMRQRAKSESSDEPIEQGWKTAPGFDATHEPLMPLRRKSVEAQMSILEPRPLTLAKQQHRS